MNIVYSVRDSVKVQNEKGTSKRPLCTCGGWLKHWEKFSKKKQKQCSIVDCDKIANAGAHITRPQAKNEDYKTHSYIVPMCTSHNSMHGEIFETKENSTFVWANVQETCGK